MKSNIFIRRLRKFYAYKCIFPVLISFLVIGLTLESPLPNLLQPVPAVSLQDLDTLYGTQKPYFTLEVSSLYYTGYDYLRNGRPHGSIYYDLTDNICRFFILEYNGQEAPESILTDTRIRGKLIYDSQLLEDLIENMSKELNWTPAGVKETVFPYLVSSVHLMSFNEIIFYLCLAFVLITSAADLLRSIFLFLFPYSSPALSHMGKGRAAKKGNLELFAGQLERTGSIPRNGIMVTDDFLFYLDYLHMKIIPVKSVAWVYTHNRLRRFFHWKLNMTQMLHIATVNRRYYDWPNRRNHDGERIIARLKEINPDILTGYSEQNKNAFQMR